MFIGSPVLPQGLFEDGVAATLDKMRDLSAVNSVMTFSNNLVTRQYRPGQTPPVDSASGKIQTDVYVRTHEEYYKNTPLRQVRNPEHLYSDRDLIDELCDAAASRDMTVYGRILEPYVITGSIPGAERCAEVGANGEETNHICFNHPDYVAFWDGVVTDLAKSHPAMTGFKFGQERGGPIGKALSGSTATCFCPTCCALAEKQGIRVNVARDGLLEIQKFATEYHKELDADTPETQIPRDGFFVTFMRILSKYPDLLSWERFWMDSREQQRRRMYTTLKGINPDLQVGWHIDHGMSWDLFTRAFWDYADMTPHSDWLSVAVYFDCLGKRSFNHFRNFYEARLFADAEPSLAHDMYFSMLGYNPKREPDYHTQKAKQTALSAEYVFAETKRALKGVNGQAKIYPRIGFDMPEPLCFAKVGPDEVYAATTRALEAGADGLFCGREWDELTDPNRAAFGNAVRDWFKQHS